MGLVYPIAGCARRGVSGALYPKSAYAGLNSHSRVLFRTGVDHPTGRRATDGHEPRQVREEAAISDAVCVVDRSRSYRWPSFSGRNSKVGAQPLLRPETSLPRVVPLIYKSFQSFLNSHLDKPTYVITFWSSFGRLIDFARKLSKIQEKLSPDAGWKKNKNRRRQTVSRKYD